MLCCCRCCLVVLTIPNTGRVWILGTFSGPVTKYYPMDVEFYRPDNCHRAPRKGNLVWNSHIFPPHSLTSCVQATRLLTPHKGSIDPPTQWDADALDNRRVFPYAFFAWRVPGAESMPPSARLHINGRAQGRVFHHAPMGVSFGVGAQDAPANMGALRDCSSPIDTLAVAPPRVPCRPIAAKGTLYPREPPVPKWLKEPVLASGEGWREFLIVVDTRSVALTIRVGLMLVHLCIFVVICFCYPFMGHRNGLDTTVSPQ